MSMLDISDTENRIAERLNPASQSALSVSTQAGGLNFTNMLQAMDFAKLMAISGVAIPKFLRANVGTCLAVTIQAVEWRMSPFAVANKAYMVNDRLAYESQLIQAVILARAPIKGRFSVSYSGEGDKRKCRVWTLLNDGTEKDYESPEIGRIPIKNSPLWKGDPDQQLYYFAGRSLCRRHFPDVLLGIYTPEELEYAEPRDITPEIEGPRRTPQEPLRTSTESRLDAVAGERPKRAYNKRTPQAPVDVQATREMDDDAFLNGKSTVITHTEGGRQSETANHHTDDIDSATEMYDRQPGDSI